MRVNFLCLCVTCIVAGCGDGFLSQEPDHAAVAAEVDELGEVRPVLRPNDASVGAATSGGVPRIGALGETVATLDATAPGRWLKTPLVRVEQSGTIVFGAKQLAVRLIPIDGPETGGSLISLEAMREIDAPLTGFPKLQVFGG